MKDDRVHPVRGPAAAAERYCLMALVILPLAFVPLHLLSSAAEIARGLLGAYGGISAPLIVKAVSIFVLPVVLIAVIGFLMMGRVVPLAISLPFILVIGHASYVACVIIMRWSGNEGGGSDAIFGAVGYQISLAPLMVCGLLAVYLADRRGVRLPLLLTVSLAIVIIYAMFAIAQGVANNLLLPQQAIIEMMQAGDSIKFDQINGRIRASAFFKSAIELCLWCIIFLAVAWSWRRLGPRQLFLVTGLLVAAVWCSVIRTGIASLAVFVGVFIFIRKIPPCGLRRSATPSILVGTFALIYAFPVLFLAMPNHCAQLVARGCAKLSAETAVVFDPTNLLIRLNNWRDLVLSWREEGWDGIVLGNGIIQNGNYMPNSAREIDSAYIAMVYAGGLVGLMLYVFLPISFIVASVRNESLSERGRAACVALWSSFMFGCITENLTPKLWIPIAGTCLIWMVSVDVPRTRAGRAAV